MSDEPYSKREMDTLFTNMDDRLTHQDDVLEKILIQTTKTNGRVTANEIKQAELQTTVNIKFWAIIFIAGAIAAFLAWMIPYTIKVVENNQDVQIQQSVSEAVPNAVNQAMAQIEQKYDINVDNTP